MNLYNDLVVEFCELLNELIDLCVKVVDAPRASKARNQPQVLRPNPVMLSDAWNSDLARISHLGLQPPNINN